jgi:signal transduction histidine kinase
MKHLIILFILLNVHWAAVAQWDTSVIRLNKIGAEGILLNKGWKFQPGDNLQWSQQSFDDSHWQSVDPTKDIHDLPQLWKGIGWLRLHFSIDSAVNGSLAMEIQQSGASEIYLNGKLLHRFGVVSTNPNAIKAFSPDRPFSLPNSRNTEQVLAVRYTLQPRIKYSTHYGKENKGLFIRVNTLENGNYQYPDLIYQAKANMFRVGVFAILAILYLAFYLFNRTQKVNLLFSVYAFIQAIVWMQSLWLKSLQYVQPLFWINNLLLAIQVLSFLFMITAIYRLLEQKRGWIFYSLIALGIISIPIGALFYGWGWLIFGLLFTHLTNIEITRIALKAVRNRKKGAWIIAAGGISYLVLWFLFTLQWYDISEGFGVDTFTFAFISIPVAVSIYLGYDFAETYRSLQQKLAEVETLSKEKQQILEAQKETLERQVTQRTAELKHSLEELKATQAQLIQSEKMASLGELTAGIAHEIQNPLNFVNNFSEVNTELIEDLKAELATGNQQEAIKIADDIKGNEEKINHHGKRADAIVKGMLQHSRASSGKKELTDINALCDEYLRLSYHGLRAKDKSFNAKFETDFDNSIGNINIISQDIGRVVLNLINNAFYAVNEKKNQQPDGYEPTVSVSTKKINDKIEIRVKDNGMGIPQKVLDKIFQPFFTTKPTGQGTGLGLSLSYDIIKAHGGEIKVETMEGEGTTFVITIPSI